MDPVSVFVGGLGLGFVNAIGPRLVQRLVPTPFDKAQVVSIEVQRQRLLDEERRFEFQTAEARARLLQELQHRTDMIELQEQLRRWQFDFLPSDFISASQKAGGKALNLVLRLSDHRRGDAGTHDPVAIVLKDAVMAAEEQMLALYAGERLFPRAPKAAPTNGVLFYADYRVGRELPIQSAVTALSSLLSSEPVILVDIAIRDGLRYRVTVSHWGNAMGDASQPTILTPQTLDLSSIATSAPDRVGPVLSLTITALLVALSDSFHLLRHMSALPEPAMPGLIQYARRSPLASLDWAGVSPVYKRTLDALGGSAPAIAVEMAAGLALAAHNGSEISLSHDFLEIAVRFYCVSQSLTATSQEILNRLDGSTRSRDYPRLLEALKNIAGLQADPMAVSRNKDRAYALLVQSRNKIN